MTIGPESGSPEEGKLPERSEDDQLLAAAKLAEQWGPPQQDQTQIPVESSSPEGPRMVQPLPDHLITPAIQAGVDRMREVHEPVVDEDAQAIAQQKLRDAYNRTAVLSAEAVNAARTSNEARGLDN